MQRILSYNLSNCAKSYAKTPGNSLKSGEVERAENLHGQKNRIQLCASVNEGTTDATELATFLSYSQPECTGNFKGRRTIDYIRRHRRSGYRSQRGQGTECYGNSDQCKHQCQAE